MRIDSDTLVVDLDGTLIKTDCLWEAMLKLLKTSPWAIFPVFLSLFRGKTAFKEALARNVVLDPAMLPYRSGMLDTIRQAREAGKQVILATASPRVWAEAVAKHLGLFDQVLASDETINLKADAKWEALQTRLGQGNFCYAGNAAADLALWKHLPEGIVVNPPWRVLNGARQVLPKLHLMASTTKWPAVLMRSMRVHQWVKNVLIFLPLIASHRIFEPDLLPLILAAFASFCLCASGIYLVNDLVDLEADRQHHRKKNRPLAAGDLPLSKTMILVPALLAAGILVGTMAGLDFLCVLLLYLLLTSLYSFYLKRTLLLDVVFLASLYTVRIFAGSEATQIPVSRWLLAFSLFLFFSLALLKRYTELIRANGGKIHSRSYLPSDAPAIFSLGAASGFIAVLVSALYVTSPEVGILYHNPDRLWFVVPLLLLWISRIWLLGHRNLIDDDPVVFSLRDPGSYALGALTILVMLWAN